MTEEYWSTNNLSKMTQTDVRAEGGLCAYSSGSGGLEHVVFCDAGGHIHEFYYRDGWHHLDLVANTGAPLAAGEPSAAFGKHQHVVYRGKDGHVHELYFQDRWHHACLTDRVGAEVSAVDPWVYTLPNGSPRVIYCCARGRVRELYWDDGWRAADLTHRTSAPRCVGMPQAYATPSGGQHVVFRDGSGHIQQLYFRDGWKRLDLTANTSAPGCAGRPFGYSTPSGSEHVVYRDELGHVHELYYQGSWQHLNLTELAGASPVTGDPMGYYAAVDDGQHVVAVGAGGRVVEFYFHEGWQVAVHNPGGPDVRHVHGYSSSVDGNQRLVSVDTNGHVREMKNRENRIYWNATAVRNAINHGERFTVVLPNLMAGLIPSSVVTAGAALTEAQITLILAIAPLAIFASLAAYAISKGYKVKRKTPNGGELVFEPPKKR